jgi:hypothetical protein
MNRSTRKMLWRAVCAGVLILLLGLWALKAGKEGLSNFYLQSAYQGLDRPAAPGERLRGEEWMRVMKYLTDSLRYSPRNPWTLEEMGALQMRRMRAPTDSRLPMVAVRSANVNYHMALMQRPTSPVAWANLALTKLYLDEQDDELFGALRHADELGPWEPEVQQLVLFVSLAAWDKLGAAQRAAVVRTLERAAQRDAGKAANIVESFKRLDLLCDIKNDKLKVEEPCSRLRK